jgi:alkanesulfonate monooxygenase SsuD/methylene tetrahydromethanopterin reductase-like flavin-dependent oxidoreductase (luciferase family)
VRAFRFSTNTYGLTSGADFAGFCRRAEDLGYDTIFAADHLGDAAPFQQAVAAAAATERVRVGTLVINVPFWNVALLAREIATADILTEGRLEVGLGSGHMKWEFDEAGIAWEPYR